jgi:hypothetical protein
MIVVIDVYLFIVAHKNDPKANFCCVCGLEFKAKEDLFAEKLAALDGAGSAGSGVGATGGSGGGGGSGGDALTKRRSKPSRASSLSGSRRAARRTDK